MSYHLIFASASRSEGLNYEVFVSLKQLVFNPRESNGLQLLHLAKDDHQILPEPPYVHHFILQLALF
jgi:hypothetical protein